MINKFIQIVPPLHFVEADLRLDEWLGQHNVTLPQISVGLREDILRWFDGSRKRYMLHKSVLDDLQIKYSDEQR